MPSLVRHPVEPDRLEGVGAPNPAISVLGHRRDGRFCSEFEAGVTQETGPGGWDGGGAHQPEGGGGRDAAEPGGAIARATAQDRAYRRGGAHEVSGQDLCDRASEPSGWLKPMDDDFSVAGQFEGLRGDSACPTSVGVGSLARTAAPPAG
jgi:hypothetical protein